MTDPGSWLDGRLAEAPAELQEAVRRATDRADPGAAAGGGLFQGCAEDLLAGARGGPATRETALTLLAADALMTLACEWVAEHEPERLRD